MKRIVMYLILIMVLIADAIILRNIFFPRLEVVLNGNEIITMSVGNDYQDDGAYLLRNNKKVSNKNTKLTKIVNLNTKVIGDYNITYKFDYFNRTIEKTRYIKVIDDIAPVINVNNKKVSYSKCSGTYEDDLDFKAIDNYDGDITDKVEVIKKDDEYVLNAVDSSGNFSTTSIETYNLDNNIFKIYLNGSKDEYITLNSNYNDKGAYVTDNCGEKVEKEITTNSTLNTSKVGTYTIKYTIKDTNTYVERKIHVYEKAQSTVNTNTGEKIVYLTFDDGPGQYTSKLLDILKKYDVKATFFVTNQFTKYVPLIEREHNEGHVVAVHSLTHKWSIYKSMDAYLNDFNAMNDIIEKYTGTRSKIFRFPGGSSNTISKGQSKGIMSALASKMTADGYVYFDWNVDSNDAAGAGRDKVVANVKAGIKSRNYSVVLMHDIKSGTVNAIEEIIQYGLNNGYTFKTLDTSSPTVHHHINN